MFLMRLLGGMVLAEFKHSQEEQKPLRELDYTAREVFVRGGGG
jgi:hypothetical protein